MAGTDPTRLRVEVRATPRVAPRLLTLVTGRSFRIVGCDYRELPGQRGRMTLDLQGPAPRHLVARLASLPDVLDVEVVDGVAERARTPFQVVRARCSTRVAGSVVLTEAAVALRAGDVEVLAAGEGSGPVEALARAFADGVGRLAGGTMAPVVVTDVTLAVGRPGGGLAADVEIVLAGSVKGVAITARGASGDVVQAAVDALTALYGHAVHVVAPATVSATA